MPIQIDSSSIRFDGEIIQFSDFCHLVERHLHCNPDTPNLEAKGFQLKSADFPEPELESFIRRVCAWGGYAGIGRQIINQNPLAKIRVRFQSAMVKLDAPVPDVSGALREVNLIRTLGKPSFASKHLRFLRPDICPVLDSIISNKMNYSYNVFGYQEFSSDCLKVAALLQSNRIENPRNRDNNTWFASDVESAIFSFINKF